MFTQFKQIKEQLITDTKAEHKYRVGDMIIKNAFVEATDEYFGDGGSNEKLTKDIQRFIKKYVKIDMTKEDKKMEKLALLTVTRIRGRLQKIEGILTGIR